MDFQKLLKQAAQNTATQQAELAQKEKARQAAAREAEAAAAKKAAADKKAAEQRKKERAERDRKFKEEEARRKAALPPTRNLYALKQERIKRGLDPDGKDDHLLGGVKAGPSKSSSSASATSKKTSSSLGSSRPLPPKEKDTYVSREDKLAKQRKAMFKDDDEELSGSMLLARMQKGVSKDERVSPKPSGTLSPRPSANGITSNGSSSKLNPLSSASSSSRPPTAPTSKTPSASAKDRLKAGFDPTKFVRLNAEKRDTRTIEEIEADMRRKRLGDSPAAGSAPARPNGPSRTNSSNGKSVAGTSTASAVRPGSSTALSAAAPKRKPDLDERSAPKRPKLEQRHSSSSALPKARRRQPSSTEESDSGSDDSRDGRRGRRGGDYGLKESMRSEIWQLMGRDRNKDVMRDLDSDDEDMEATGADVLREEQRAARMAAKEDAEEQERLTLAAERKRARLNKG